MLNDGFEWAHQECFVYSQREGKWWLLSLNSPQSPASRRLDQLGSPKQAPPRSLPEPKNPAFQQWVMGGEDRISMLRQGLASVSKLEQCVGCMVLTNGFDDDAVEVLRGVGLLDFFGAIVGTQSLRQGGGCISFIRPDVAHRIREASGLAADSTSRLQSNLVCGLESENDSDRFEKPEVLHNLLEGPDTQQWVMEAFGGPVDEIIYIDDHLEVSTKKRLAGPGSGNVQTVELPHEGAGLAAAHFDQITELTIQAAMESDRDPVRLVVVFDFDCTLSRYHMFKTTNQDRRSRNKWNEFLKEQGQPPAPSGWRPKGRAKHISERANEPLMSPTDGREPLMSPSPPQSEAP